MKQSICYFWGTRFFAIFLQSASLCLFLLACEKPTPPQPPVPEVGVWAIKESPLALTFDFVGQTVSFRTVEVRARVEGILMKRLFEEGQFVPENKVLFKIDPRPAAAALDQAQAQAAQAKALATNAQKNFQRMKALIKQNAVSQKDFDDAQAAALKTAADVQATAAAVRAARLDLEYTTVTASISGLTSTAFQKEGALVSPRSANTSLLAFITQLDPIYVTFSVTEREFLEFQRFFKNKQGPGFDWKALDLSLTLSDGSLYAHKGKINFSDPLIDEKTGTFSVRAQFPNTNHGLKPGQFVRVTVGGMGTIPAILIPSRAVLQNQKGKYVLVIQQNKAIERPVEGEEKGGNLFWVKKGLFADEKIIVDGMMMVKSGAPVRMRLDSAAIPVEPAKEK